MLDHTRVIVELHRSMAASVLKQPSAAHHSTSILGQHLCRFSDAGFPARVDTAMPASENLHNTD